MAKLPSQVQLDITALTGVLVNGGNPAAAWAAYHLARTNGLPIPPAVAAEIDRFAAEIAAPALLGWDGDDRAQITAKDVTDAWGISRVRGKGAVRDLHVKNRNARIVCDYVETMRQGGRDCDAVDALVEKYPLGEGTIREILTSARKELRADDPASVTDDPWAIRF